jgi:predicted Zn-dependent protease
MLDAGRMAEFDQLVNAHPLPFQQGPALRKILIEREVALGRVEEALERAESFLAEFPGETDVLLLMGDLYRHLNQPARARQIYQQVLKWEPHNREVRERLEKLETMPV